MKLPAHPVRTGQARRGFPARITLFHIVPLDPAYPTGAGRGTIRSLLEELIREGARRLLQAAIEQEVTEYLERFREEKDDKGHRMVVRNGRLPERMFVTGVGPLRIHQPRIRDKREGETFTSAILPRYLRRVPTIDTLLPVLYLKGISTGDMMPALEALLGPDTPGLSATNIVRLKRVWETEYREWTKRDLSGKRYVYVWADGIHFNVRLEDAERNRQCFLILIGALENGEIFLGCFHDGQPIPFNNKQPTSTGGLKRPGLVRPLKRF